LIAGGVRREPRHLARGERARATALDTACGQHCSYAEITDPCYAELRRMAREDGKRASARSAPGNSWRLAQGERTDIASIEAMS
jgi:hypothetical protein